MASGEVVQIEAYPKPPLAVLIPNGNKISNPIDTEGYNLTGLLVPDAWDGGATITFLVAEKGEPETAQPTSPRYRPLVTAAGSAVSLTGVAAGTMISLSNVPELKGQRYIKMQAASNVGADRTLQATRVQYVQ